MKKVQFFTVIFFILISFSTVQAELELLFDGVPVNPYAYADVKSGQTHRITVVNNGMDKINALFECHDYLYLVEPREPFDLSLTYKASSPNYSSHAYYSSSNGVEYYELSMSPHGQNNIPTGKVYEFELTAHGFNAFDIYLWDQRTGNILSLTIVFTPGNNTITATNNWDGSVTVNWVDQGSVKLIRQEEGNPSNMKEWDLAGSTFEDKYETSEFKKKYIYIVKRLNGTEIGRTTESVMPDIVVVLVRGYSLFNGTNGDYWKVPDKWKNKGLYDDVGGVKGWFEDKGITCWDASSNLYGTDTIQRNANLLGNYLNTKRTGDYEDCKIYLFGHSMGGQISRQFANDNPGIVDKIFCAQTPHTGSPLAYIRGLYWDNHATYNLLPPICDSFNRSIDIGDTGLYSIYSSNFKNICYDYGLITAGGIMMSPGLNPLSFLRYFPNTNDGIVPSESAKGRSWRITTVRMDGLYNSHLDHYSCYRHPDTLNKVMEWLYPQAASPSPPAMQMQTLTENEQEIVPLYFIAGFEGQFDSTQPVLETVNVGASQKAYFRTVTSDPDSVFTLTKPDAVVINPTIAASDPNVAYYNEGGIQSYEVTDPLPGTWSLSLTTLLSEPDGVQYGLTAFEDQNISFAVSSKDWTSTGQSILLTARLFDNSGAVVGATVTAEVTLPDETVQAITLFDDGTNGDDTADDGIYSYAFISTSLEGIYSVHGHAVAAAFERTAAASFTATSADITISGLVSDDGVDTNQNTYFDLLRFNVPVTVSVGKSYRLTASLYDLNSETISLVNTGILSMTTDANSISVEIDAHKIVKHNVDGPYTLQNIEISDAGTGLIIADVNDYTTAAYQVSDFEPLDSDGDGLPDVLEQSIGTDINKLDTDADGATDYQEISLDGDSSSYNPQTDSNPLVQDTDSDGFTDGYEIIYGLNPLVDDTARDLDGDGLTNQQEYDLHTRPNEIDTDDDNRNDKWEIDNSTNPLVFEYFDKVIADINLDAIVNILDLSIMAKQWLDEHGEPSADISTPTDGIVNALDLIVLAEHWLEGTTP